MAKITYIKDGENSKSQLIIDGEQVDATDYGVASNIHAIQWNGSSGEIEYNDGTPNATITDISSFDFETKHATEKQAIADLEIDEIDGVACVSSSISISFSFSSVFDR